MSYYEDDAGDDYMTTEQALDGGWLDPDTVQEIRELVAKVDTTTPEPGSTYLAALVLISMKLDPKPEIERQGPDPMISWARVLLGLD